ncbi:hypothetical protein COEREDRAFT_80818 [Coemansia reversa NRRL 1564]|uniref:Peptidase S1 domain-containing protein n=1 Tax=Coemansia reversa (strain ATCC 12441 / NRRL 1564) TaxID=763665 RepID=A0A2G5BDQ1_COERN|nr:hypothetical protein COEREDRAFT_80818 [Coemansia reversa NRRL 1564]|eukprot:PIA17112.1 hypothetical protein COEREDRAFT_80818 [Coemansia reversa NRRL 1564]
MVGFLVLVAAICALLAVAIAANDDTSVVKLSDYPSVLYVATPFAICFGALLSDRIVITDARCLHPFSNGDGASDKVSGTLDPDYLMVALPTEGISTTMHNILLSTQVFKGIDQAGPRASTFFGLVANYIDNSTFYGVNSSAVHAYYPQSEYVESAEMNFDVGIVTLKHPIKKAKLAVLELDDIDAGMSGLTALSFAPPSTTDDPATLQTLYEGIDLTRAKKTAVTSLSRSDCDSNYKKAYDLDNMKSFKGHGLPDNNSPIFCTSFYDNTTACEEDSSIQITDSGDGVHSVNLNSTLFFVPSGSTIRVVGLGFPHLFEVRSDSSSSCSSNGFIHFPRTGLYIDWIGWSTGGSIVSDGSWNDKPLTGNIIEDFVNPGGAPALLTSYTTALVTITTIIVATFVAM